MKNGTGVGGPDERARVHGHQLAAKLDERGGQWVLVEAFDEDGDGDEVWLARTVPAAPLDEKCCRRTTKQTTLHGEETRSTAFSEGDYAIMVEWFERVPEDPERRTFVHGGEPACFINSTELRLVVDPGGIERLGRHSFPSGGGGGGGGGGGDGGGGGAGGGDSSKFRLKRDQEAFAQEWCR